MTVTTTPLLNDSSCYRNNLYLIPASCPQIIPSMSTPSSSSSSSPIATPPPSTPPNLHQNSIDPSAKWIVQKFGGTSVGKFAVKIAEDIVSSVPVLSLLFLNLTTVHRDYIDRHKVAIVCSARSGSSKALGTTNLLLKASAEALHRKEVTTPAFTPGFTTPVTNGTFSPDPSKSYSPEGSDDGRSRSRSSSAGPSSSSFSFGFSSITRDKPPPFSVTVDLIRSEHVDVARENIRDPLLLKELEAEIERDCDALRAFLFAAQVCLLA